MKVESIYSEIWLSQEIISKENSSKCSCDLYGWTEAISNMPRSNLTQMKLSQIFKKTCQSFWYYKFQSTLSWSIPPSKDELHQVSIASGLIADSKVAKRLGQRENFEKIMAKCPELRYDMKSWSNNWPTMDLLNWFLTISLKCSTILSP